MSTEHPYLFINDEMKLEWVTGTNARVKCIHQPDINYRKDLGLGSEELVTDFVRFNRNYYSVYTDKNKTYEIGPHGEEEIMIVADIPPVYSAGWYFSTSEDKYLTFTNRRHPNTCIKIAKPTNIGTVLSMHIMPYTDIMILNTTKCVYKYVFNTDKKELTHQKSLCSSADIVAHDEDGAVLAAVHYDGKITVIWTSSWKTHHTLRSPNVYSIAINQKNIVASTKKDGHMYIWDLASGDVIQTISMPWHSPSYVSFNDCIQGLGINTFDIHTGLMTIWEVSDNPSMNLWPLHELNKGTHLVCVLDFSQTISTVAINGSNLLLNADGYILKGNINLNSKKFLWFNRVLEWMKNPVDDLYLESLYNTDNELPGIVKYTLVNNMKFIVLNIIESLSRGKKCSHWSLYKLLKIEVIREAFDSHFLYFLTKLYGDNGYRDRETTLILISYARTVNINMAEFIDTLTVPVSTSDFIFWDTLFTLSVHDYKKQIGDREDVTNAAFTVYELSEEPETRTCARDFLYATHLYIKHWGEIMGNPMIFDFVTPSVIRDSCTKGYINDWMKAFLECKKLNKMNNNIQNCWNEFVQYVLEKDVMRTYRFPNPNDGKWMKKPADEIRNNTWIMMDETVTEYKATEHELGEGLIKCWVENDAGCRNAIERALKILDIDTWEADSKWTQDCSDRDEFVPGYEVKTDELGVARVIQWPVCMLKSGIVCEFPSEGVYFRAPKLDFCVPVHLLHNAEKYIRALILSGNLPDIPDHFKPVLFDMLSPSVVKECRNVDFSFCEITSMTIDSKNNIWLGTVDGSIFITPLADICLPADKREFKEVHNSHTEAITTMDSKFSLVATSGDDSVVKVWDILTFKCLATLDDLNNYNPVKCVRFVKSDTLWVMGGLGSISSWNFITDRKPEPVQTLRDNKTLLGHNSMSVYDKYCVCVTQRICHWFTDYPYQLNTAQMCRHLYISCVVLVSCSDYLIGTIKGEVYMYSIDDSEDTELIWEDNKESVTTILPLNISSASATLVIGLESGRVVLTPLDDSDSTDYFDYKGTNHKAIKSLVYCSPYIIALTADYQVFIMLYQDRQVEMAANCLVELSKIHDWRTFLKREKYTLSIQRILIEGMKRIPRPEHFADIIEMCLLDEDNCKAWCKKEILDVIHVGATFSPSKFRPILNKLFCYSGRKFTCTLCLGQSSSPKRFPITAITSCMHRFHTKCIEEHCRKAREWDDECQQNWALRVTLSCPICREPFHRSDLVEDKLTAELCKYSSSDED